MREHAWYSDLGSVKPNEEEEKFTGQRSANLKSIPHPALVVNGIHDSPVQNSYWLVRTCPKRSFSPTRFGPRPGKVVDHPASSMGPHWRRDGHAAFGLCRYVGIMACELRPRPSVIAFRANTCEALKHDAKRGTFRFRPRLPTGRERSKSGGRRPVEPLGAHFRSALSPAAFLGSAWLAMP